VIEVVVHIPTMSRLEIDKQYVRAVAGSVYFYASVLSIIVWLSGYIGVNVPIPHWALLALAMLFLTLAQFEAYKSQYNKVKALEGQLKPKEPELSEQAIALLCAAVDSLSDVYRDIAVEQNNFGATVNVGRFIFACSDELEGLRYLEAVDLLYEGKWAKRPCDGNPSYYVLTAKGLQDGKAILATPEGQAIIAEVRRRFGVHV